MPKKPGTKASKLTRKQKIRAATVSEYGVAGGSAELKEEYLETPVKSDADPSQYRVIRLANGLVVTLMSAPLHPRKANKDATTSAAADDPKCGTPKKKDRLKDDPGAQWANKLLDVVDRTSERAHCCLSVNVGWFSDLPFLPQTISAIVRNTILVSSRKYPEENSFYNFVKSSNGTLSVSPENCEVTCFSFAVREQHFCEGLDRFSNCFANPRFRRTSILELRNAQVTRHEYDFISDKSLSQKSRLLHFLASHNSQHPGKLIGQANLQKMYHRLGDDGVCEKVEAFMKRHYSAHRMKLVIKAQLPLDTLEEYARKYFSRIPNNNLPSVDLSMFSWNQCYNIPAFNMIYEMTPELNLHREKIEISWTMPPLSKNYRTKPQQYITTILRNPMEGSLSSYLYQENLCVTTSVLNAEIDLENNSIYYVFTLSVQLTTEGKERVKEVLDAIYSFINFMRLKANDIQIYDRVRRVAESRFRVDADNLAEDAAKYLRKTMQFYPSVDYLTGDSLYYDYNPDLIKTCLDCMTPEKSLIILHGHDMISQCLVDDSDSEDEEVRAFTRTHIPKKWINDWNSMEPRSCFKFPRPNIFCPNDYSLVTRPTTLPKVPEKIYSDQTYEVWHRLGGTRHGPNCGARFNYINEVVFESVENAMMLELLVKLLPRLFTEDLYPANMAGMNYLIHTFDGEFTIELIGTRDNLPLLVHMLGNYIATCSDLLSEGLLSAVKDEMVAYYYGIHANTTDAVARDIQTAILKNNYWTLPEKLAVLPTITFEKFKYFLQHFTDNIYIRSFIHGNMEAHEALDLVRRFVAVLTTKPHKPNTNLIYGMNMIPRGSHFFRVQRLTAKRTYHCVMNHYTIGKYCPRTAAALELLLLVIENPIFASIRTRQNLEFSDIEVVVQLYRNQSVLLGYYLVAKNHDAVPDFSVGNAKIEGYRNSFRTLLENLSPTEWEIIKMTYVRMKNLPSMINQDVIEWQEIKTAQYDFDRDEKQSQAISQLPINELRKLIISLVTADENTRKLSTQVMGHTVYQPNQPIPTGTSSDFDWRVLIDTTPGQAYDYCITDISLYKSSLPTVDDIDRC